jgi:GNAT superfamily N-acetyltransferase
MRVVSGISASLPRVSVEVKPVAGKRDLMRFIKLPWRLYRNERNWVPPLVSERKKFLDRDENPFFEHAEAEFFLAWRDGEPVGRISAHLDRNLNEFQHNEWGLFGFFESEEDPEVANALLEAAETWLRERGRDRMVGPMDFTTNDECGLLVEGHDRQPMVLQGWHHPYYRELLEGYGLGKAMDLYMWQLRLDEVEDKGGFHPLIHAAAKKVTGEYGVTIRHMRKREFETELGRFLEVYNAAWERNWGFVPLTEKEVRHYAKDLKPILDEKWTWIAERDGEVLGAALTLPDINVALAHMNGRLLPLGWAKFLWWRRKIRSCRVLALGVKPEYQDLGIAGAFYIEHLNNAREPGAIWWGEMGWILETNEAMNRAMEGMGGKIVKRYRIFDKPLDGDSRPPAVPSDSAAESIAADH